ncbi:thioredoxin-like protein 1 [Amphibalanus amphitrite]|nr:thioredoxin-like protein 1 [Amphibalanus amphitrite]XP_043208311.1 thioredoxin-like protein 1 [Amphibalanus amphitrite]XP_043208312.1 thioredoxin-like protein 1 [Amphibalanus amphitrite]XP_043208313.1 thioredoxin-like protein 1 [Amphibalanus amphitrite]XP_043208314.1 thioredoxin-like protein 1 [Amphibalanus amphitrite]XP_043236034.1 thioredoxin-like protein 1 [Amphibalanus amphitrite]XP_043236036.1 thioredoxin-like protein 1 [Amphibalanus amphitrite]XP_043236037.1 thioredoxin-like protein
MTNNLKVLSEDGLLAGELASAGQRLVVADFTATWCGPCQRIAPVFLEYAKRYPKALFLKIDVDECPDTAAAQGVRAMPTFIFYRSKNKIDSMQGADQRMLEDKIKQHYGSGDGDDAAEDCGVAGHIDLAQYIHQGSCECLNESDERPFAGALKAGAGYLESDCDEQLILSLAFSQAVKVHSLRLRAPAENGPKNVKIFINQPNTLDFDKAESMTPVQELELTKDDLADGIVPLRYVKFQNVTNLQLFFRDNQTGADTTRIDHIAIIGSLIGTTNMQEFKRVAGKKGEAH